MKLGVAIPAVTLPADNALAELECWAEQAGRMPDIVPVWTRPGWQATVAAIEGAGMETMIYHVSPRGLLDPDDVASRIVRFDQEPNGDWNVPWANVSPDSYIDRFDAFAASLPNARPFYCPIWTGRDFAGDLDAYWPVLADVIGFDIYFRHNATVGGAARRIERACRFIRNEDDYRPIVIGELGIHVDAPRRRAILRAVMEAAADSGVEALVYFDIDMDQERWPGHLWRMGPRMRRVYGRSGR